MSFPSDEQIAALKAKHGEELCALETAGGDVILRPATKAEFDALTNAMRSASGLQSARHNAAIECTVWPDNASVASLLDDFPATSELICVQLTVMAGGHNDDVERLAPVVLGALTAEEIATLAAAGCDVSALKAKHPKRGALMVMRTPLGPFIMRRPARPVYDEFVKEQGKDAAAAAYNLVLGCVLHPAAPTAIGVFAKLPALPLAMSDRLSAMAGSENSLRAKKL